MTTRQAETAVAVPTRFLVTDGTVAGSQVGISTPAQARTALNVEDGADVTDTANVTSAGALMDSEVTDLAGVKGVTISTLQPKPAEGAFVNGDKTKLDGIEALADVTDATNVEAAGALMDSEVDADLKTFALPANTTISTFGASLVDDAAATNARTTLELAGVKNSAIEFIIDGGGSAITTGVKGFLEVPFACTITAARLLADQSGSIVVDVWKDTYANYPPTDADSITASAPPTISTAVKAEDTTLTGWTTAVAAGDILGFNVDSITTCQRVTVVLRVTIT